MYSIQIPSENKSTLYTCLRFQGFCPIIVADQLRDLIFMCGTHRRYQTGAIESGNR